MNRYVIALNHLLVKKDGEIMDKNREKSSDLILFEDISKLMDFVRKYPEIKIQREKLYTYGFSKN